MTYNIDAEDAFLEAAYEDLTHIQDEPDDSRCPGHDPYPHSCSLDREDEGEWWDGPPDDFWAEDETTCRATPAAAAFASSPSRVMSGLRVPPSSVMMRSIRNPSS